MENINLQFIVTDNLEALQKHLAGVNKQLAIQSQAFSAMSRDQTAELSKINKAFADNITQTGHFSHATVDVLSTTQKFGRALQENKLRLTDYFGAFRSHLRDQKGLITDLAREQMRYQQSVVKTLGRDSRGVMQASVTVPAQVNEEVAGFNKGLAIEKLKVFNAVVSQGATKLIDFGKNTQWAGRQMMVGLTIPIAIFGAAAVKAFNEVDQELVRLQKVYGSGFTFGEDFIKQSKMIRQEALNMGIDIAKTLGVAVKDTVALTADLAATGLEGNKLLEATTQTTRLSVLGEVDRQEAMKATIAIQNAFKVSSADLANTVNFLNAVENQTSTSLADLVEAIPRAGPVVRGLGGDIKDLALYITAMREGGVSAAEGANALKSALSSLINPSTKALKLLDTLGIDLKSIVARNAGNLTPTILELKGALDGLTDLQRNQVLTTLFGKFQFARIAALFNNIGVAGSQTVEVMKLMGASVEQLGAVADQELKTKTESASGRFKIMTESIKAELIPFGEMFMQALTPIGNFVVKVLDKVNSLPYGVKMFGAIATALVALVGPATMLIGIFANLTGTVIKFGHLVYNIFKGRGIIQSFELYNESTIAAKLVTEDMIHTLNVQGDAFAALTAQIEVYTNALTEFENKQKAIAEAKAAGGVRNVAGAVAMDRDALLYNTAAKYGAKPATDRGVGTVLGAAVSNRARAAAGIESYSASEFTDIRQLAKLATLSDVMRQGLVATNGVIKSEDALSKMLKAAALENDTAFAEQAKAVANMALVYNDEKISIRAAYDRYLAALEQMTAEEKAAFFERVAAEHITLQKSAGGQGKAKMRLANLVVGNVENLGTELGASAQTVSQFNYEMQSMLPGLDKVSIFSEKLLLAMGQSTVYASELEHVIGEADIPAMVKLGASTEQVARAIAKGLPKISKTWSEQDRAQAILQQLNQQLGDIVPATEQMQAQAVNLAKELGKGVQTFTAVDALGREFIAIMDAEKTRMLGAVTQGGPLIAGQGSKAQLQIMDELTSATLAAEKDRLAIVAQQVAAEQTKTEQTVVQVANEGKKTAETSKQVANEVAETEAGAGGAVVAGTGRGRYARVGKGSIGLTAAMMLSMFANPSGNAGTAMNMLSYAGMGASMGYMAGPWGMAAGGAIGALVPIIQALGKASSEAKQKVRDVTKALGGIGSVSSDIAATFGGTGATFKGMKLTVDPALGVASTPMDKQFVDNVKGTMADQIEKIKKVSSEQAVNMGVEIYSQLLQKGIPSSTASEIVQEVLRQAGKSDVVMPIKIKLQGLDSKGAATMANDARNALNADLLNAFGKGEKSSNVMKSIGENIAGTLADSITSGIKDAKNFSADAKTALDDMLVKQFGSEGMGSFDKIRKLATGGLGSAKQILEGVMPKIKDINNIKDFADAYLQMTNAERAAAQEALNSAGFKEQADVLKGLELESDGVAQAFIQLNPRFADLVANMTAGASGGSQIAAVFKIIASTATQAAIAAANLNTQIDNAAQAAGARSAATARSAPTQEQIDAAKQAASDRLDAMKQAESDALDALKASHDKREQLMQDEIDNVKNRYDTEIQAIKDAAQARQDAFDREKELAQREADLNKMRLDYKQAVAGGQLFEAARIQNDIAAKQAQDLASDQAKAAQDSADARIKALETERDAKVKAMQDALDAQKEADKKSEDSAKKASDARIKAAEKSSDAATKALEKAATVTATAWTDFRDKFAKIMSDSSLTAQQKFNEILKAGGTTSEALSMMFRTTFKNLPADIQKILLEQVKSQDWQTIGKEMMVAAELPASTFAAYVAAIEAGVKVRVGQNGQIISATGQIPVERADGGLITGVGGPRDDNIMLKASNGEYVVNAQSVSKYGVDFFNKLNDGTIGVGGPAPSMLSGTVASLMDHAFTIGMSNVYVGVNKAMDALRGRAGRPAASSGAWGYPFGHRYPITSHYGSRWGRMHNGTDIGAPYGTPILAAGDGRIAFIGQDPSWASASQSVTGRAVPWMGNMAVVSGPGGYSQYYGHMSRFGPGRAGSSIRHGQVIGYVGSTGNSTGAHLHLGIKNKGSYVNPEMIIPGLNGGAKIKYDNTIANLHKQETVLTAPLSKKWEQALDALVASGGGNNYNMGDVYIGDNANISKADVRDGVMEAFRLHDQKLGRGRVIGGTK